MEALPAESEQSVRLTQEDLAATAIVAASLGLEAGEYELEVTAQHGGPEITIVPDQDLPAAS
jgi:hypothetical protein